jgi:hypothetical protein
MLSPEGYKPFYDYFNFQMKLPGIQTFYSPNNLSIPLEYQITPVDEITNIFEMFTDENYDLFVNESLEVFKKYKTRCNPKNKKLVFYTSKCDGSFKNKYTHGGYECGDDGLWTQNCVASYCDVGYIFDHTKKKCIENICKPENVFPKFIIIIASIIAFIIILFIAICICAQIQRRNRMKRRYDLNEQQVSLGFEDNKNNKNNLIN